MQCTSSMLVLSIAWGSMKQKENGSVWIKPEKSRWRTFWIRQGVTDVAEERMWSAEKIALLHGVLRSEQNNDIQSNIAYLIRGETLLMSSNRWWKLVVCHGRMYQNWKKCRTARIFELKHPFYQRFTNISGEPDLQKMSIGQGRSMGYFLWWPLCSRTWCIPTRRSCTLWNIFWHKNILQFALTFFPYKYKDTGMENRGKATKDLLTKCDLKRDCRMSIL